MKNEYVDLVWEQKPEFIREFHQKKPLYSLLCEEVKFILSKSLERSDLEVAAVSARAKTETSFCEKLHRKEYSEPFREITDFAGARVVFLYSIDRPNIEALIEEKFEIIEKVDKVLAVNEDKFGYGALHYLVKLKPDYIRARYKELENLVCEIQVRTILQDAWAVVAHHLSYKQESDIPPHLRRKLNALSGLFETADDQFENIRGLRAQYHKLITTKIEENEPDILNSNIDLDNLSAYLDWRLPDRKRSESGTAELVIELKEYNYNTLKELDDAINKTIDAVYAYEEKYPPIDSEDHNIKTNYAQIGIVRNTLGFIHDEYLMRNQTDKNMLSVNVKKKLEFKNLVK